MRSIHFPSDLWIRQYSNMPKKQQKTRSVYENNTDDMETQHTKFDGGNEGMDNEKVNGRISRVSNSKPNETEVETKTKKNPCSCLKKASDTIIKGLEFCFYK